MGNENDDWRIEWIKSLGCTPWYDIDENEVWKNENQRILVWHPVLGLRMMFTGQKMSIEVQKQIIESILSSQQEKIDKEILTISLERVRRLSMF